MRRPEEVQRVRPEPVWDLSSPVGSPPMLPEIRPLASASCWFVRWSMYGAMPGRRPIKKPQTSSLLARLAMTPRITDPPHRGAGAPSWRILCCSVASGQGGFGSSQSVVPTDSHLVSRTAIEHTFLTYAERAGKLAVPRRHHGRYPQDNPQVVLLVIPNETVIRSAVPGQTGKEFSCPGVRP